MTAPGLSARWRACAPYLRSLLRIAVAFLYAHAPHGFWPVLNQGVPAACYAFLFLYLSAAGPGPWSADALRRPGLERAG